jgi:hypothetical protein
VRQSPSDGKISIVNKNKKSLRSTNFKLPNQIKGNLINMTFLKFLISAWGGQCDYSPGERQNKTRYATEGGRLYYPSV